MTKERQWAIWTSKHYGLSAATSTNGGTADGGSDDGEEIKGPVVIVPRLASPALVRPWPFSRTNTHTLHIYKKKDHLA